jgi:tRNA pseudouridine38-40 synthase
MNNYRILIQYDGTKYAGWQIQANALTVQEELSRAVEAVLKETIILNGSGRTDSGVHALGQAANFKTSSELDLYKFKYQINSIISNDISVIAADKVEPEFHARYDARKRTYLYLISTRKNPFLAKYSWFLSNIPDIELLKKVSRIFIGRKDYSSFCKTSSETTNRICEVYDINWRYLKGVLFFTITADRFLHGMVRTIIGTILGSVKDPDPEKIITQTFEKKERSAAGESVPARGLFLYKVKYDY